MRRSTIVPWCLLTVAAVTGPALATPAVAQGAAQDAAHGVGVSTDGRTWSTSLDRALFDPRLRWVPGDSETATFYVRNQGPSSAELRVAVRSDGSSLLDLGDVVLTARASGGAWQRLTEGAAAAEPLEGRVDRRQEVRVDVNARFRAGSPDRSQSEVLPLTFEVTLLDARAGAAGAGDERADGAGSLLPDTGSPVSLGLLGAAVLLVVGGLALLRRKEKDDVRTTG